MDGANHVGRAAGHRWSILLISAIWALSVAQVIFGFVLASLNRLTLERYLAEFMVAQATATIAFATVGLLVVSRRPDNRIGWLFALAGLGSGLGAWVGQYARYTLVTEPGALPVGNLVAWLVFWSWIPFVTLVLVILPLLFPEGRLPSTRWRAVAWIAAAGTTMLVVSLAMTPGVIDSSLPDVSNPYGVEGYESLLAVLRLIGVVLLAAGLIGAVAAQVTRYRRSRGEERAQIKWFAYSTALLVAAFAVPVAIGYPDFAGSTLPAGIALAVAYPGLPIATGIAILRYRLWDIDWIISRTLVYLSLSGLLLASYAGSVIALQSVFRAVTGQSSQLAIVLSTLLVAALFQPLRRRLQRAIDRRLYRRRYDPVATLSEFSDRIKCELDRATVTDDLIDAVHVTLQPTTIAVWLSEAAPRHSRPAK